MVAGWDPVDEVDWARRSRAGVDAGRVVGRMGEPVPPVFWRRDPEDNTLMVVQ
jgi:hypothetical protein